jgi:hypothetical protein
MSGAYVATRAAGQTPMRGLARPLAEVVSACLAPRVWVWGVWFGFALRCVALLCGVFVRLHLALSPAGGPFLPSLYVNLYLRGLPRVGVSCVACVCLCLASALCLSAPMLLGVSLVLLFNTSSRGPVSRPVCGFWGFWFSFVLRCVALLCALLCAVHVRLRLVLFPAGVPFLLSLYVIIVQEPSASILCPSAPMLIGVSPLLLCNIISAPPTIQPRLIPPDCLASQRSQDVKIGVQHHQTL